MTTKYKLLSHQQKAVTQALTILRKRNVVYIAGEVRTGKTGVAIQTAYDFAVAEPQVLFLTSKKAIPSIKKDFKAMKLRMHLEIMNYESVHKVKYIPDVLILDEAHRLGKFPKPGKIVKKIRKWFEGIPTIIMSGTPSPESFSQLFHQFWATGSGPWSKYQNFYKWAHARVDITQEYIGMGHVKNNYSDVRPLALEEFNKYKVVMTQKAAGFDGEVKEKIHTIKTPKSIVEILKRLKRSKINDDPELVADTAGKLNGYFHQLSSGTVIDVEKDSHIIDEFKVNYIKKNWNLKCQKVAIFYVYREEGEMLKKAFPHYTTDPDDFNNDEIDYKVKSPGFNRMPQTKIFICQVSSGREGINLSTADAIIFFNISYSAVSYWQARARSQSRKGGNKQIHWIFSDSGIEQEIYNVVQDKKDFTNKHFSIYVRKFHSESNKKVAGENGLVVYKTTSRRSNRDARPNESKRRRSSLVHRGKETWRTTKRNTKTSYC